MHPVPIAQRVVRRNGECVALGVASAARLFAHGPLISPRNHDRSSAKSARAVHRQTRDSASVARTRAVVDRALRRGVRDR